MQELIGKLIKGIYISEGEEILAFDTDKGVIAYEVEGDCCSNSWFADIVGVSAMIGGRVLEADSMGMPEGYNVDDGRTRQEYDEAYGFKIITDKGYADIVFRNSSNGYYGGWCENIGATDISNMKPITDDWSA